MTALTDAPLVVEIGGTSLRAGRFDPARVGIEGFVRRATPDGATPSDAPTDAAAPEPLGAPLVAALRELTRAVYGDREPTAVAVAYPGPLDAAGRALAAPTLLGGPRAGSLPAAFGRVWPAARVSVLNDLTAAGIRYTARGDRDFCIVTFGSGIGHKVFAEGRPLVGPGGRGGEIGHLRLDQRADAVRCDCGGTGHVGGIASGRGSIAMVRRAARLDATGLAGSALADREIDGPAVAAAFTVGDPWVTAVLAEVAGFAATALAAIHLATGVEDFVLVGGWTHALGERYRRMLVRAAEHACWDLGQSWDRMLRLGVPDDQDALIGAGLHALAQER